MGFFEACWRYRRIARRFRVSFSIRNYIVGKLSLDPAFAAVCTEVAGSNLPIVDIGCGYGLLAHYLRELGVENPILGYDIDANKIAKARDAAARAGLRDVAFEVDDAMRELPGDTHIVALDVIHYLGKSDQAEFLASATRLAHPEARVLLRTALRDDSWRYRVTLAEEWWSRTSGWIPVEAPVNFPSAEELSRPFEAAGFVCNRRPLWGVTPFNSYLFTFHRQPAPAPAFSNSAIAR